MFCSQKLKNFRKVIALTNVSQLIRSVHGETSSFLNGATVTMSCEIDILCSAIEHLIDNLAYKSLVASYPVNYDPYENGSFWFKIDLGASKNPKT